MTIGIIKKAIDCAKKSKMWPFKVGCVIFRGKRILSCGFNQKRTSKRIPDKYKRFIETLHAEQHAVMQIKDKSLLDGANILVIRISHGGKLVMAKPCENCAKTILHFGISNVYYSTSNGEIKMEKSNELFQ